MVKLFRKIPVWAEAVLVGTILLIPTVFFIQMIIQFNVVSYKNSPCPVVLGFGILYLYWTQIKYLTFIKGNRLLKWPLKTSLIQMVGAVLALILITYSLVSIGFSYINPDQTVQLVYIRIISSRPDYVAVPLFFSLACLQV